MLCDKGNYYVKLLKVQPQKVIRLNQFQGYLFNYVKSVHTGGRMAFFSDRILHTNNKIDPSAPCSTSRVNAHFILFPLREIKRRRLC